jgi:hypothetical protein
MSESELESEIPAELTAADAAASAPVPPAAAVAALVRPLPSTVMPVGRPIQTTTIDQIQRFSSRALAEVSYQLQRVGTATLAGSAAVVIAAIVFVTSNVPQRTAVTALKSDLARPSPRGNRVAGPAATGAMLASLPPRAEAPAVVEKILEEAQATGVELPRGQYEYVPARDGVAARYRMTFPVHASYPKIREFMDRTLVALPAVAIEGLRIERKTVGDDSVDAELKLAAFVRSDP